MDQFALKLPTEMPLRAQNAGYFVSRGQGKHPSRRIASHELIFVRSGILGIREEDRTFGVGEGQSLLLWSGRLHEGTSPYVPGLSFYWVHFTMPEISAPAGAGMSVGQHASVARPDVLTGHFRRFLDDQESGLLNALSADLLVLQMLCEVARSKMPFAARKDKASVVLAGRADTYIQSRFHEPLSSSFIAAALSCNANYLAAVYREVHGRTITEAIHDRRLRHARRLLMERDLNIDEVARDCGFSDSGYFSRIFKRREGMTPMAFRRLHARLHTNTV